MSENISETDVITTCCVVVCCCCMVMVYLIPSASIGTTWMQEMVTLSLSRGDPTPSQTVPNWARAPWLEQYYCPQVLSATQGPRILTTHLPYHTLASALRGSKAKVRLTKNT